MQDPAYVGVASMVAEGRPGFTRDGYAGYDHLTTATHAECGAHLLRALKGVHESDPVGQEWAEAMANTLLIAKDMMTAAATAGRSSLEDAQVSFIRSRPTPERCRAGGRQPPPIRGPPPRSWSTASPATPPRSCGSPPTPRSGSPTTRANAISDPRSCN
ncbi:hypothetical protein C1I93_17885 [Micromonospora endophytica]|uniref:Transposase IS66 central domain-containing protein n=1 Tax=Micromonospora endophytica TaxID=515350 RepID=A0A2W2CP79_9ACTN|nr:hypothetical protein C1I93_17885 [Micromonospora endophytica]RIW41440.1 hypothetical protein D3H59_25915 [Micromonospora endophytica]